MSSSQTLATYVALMNDEPDRHLGLLVLYSVAEVAVQHADLAQHLTDVGLGDDIPRRPADVDVFRRTCSDAQRKRRPIDGEPGQYVNVLVRDVTNDEDEVVKRIVCEVVDKQKRVLAYSEVYDVTFAKATSTVDVRRIGRAIHPSADEVAMEIASEYRRLVGTVNGACIRDVIARILDKAEATSLRPGGGSYFVERSHALTVAGLEAFAAEIEGTLVHSVPLPDDPKQRQNLINAFEDQAKVDIERQIEEIAGYLKGGEPVTGDRIAIFAGRYRQIEERTAHYQKLLESTLGSTRSALTIYKQQMAQLAGLGTRPRRSTAAPAAAVESAA